MNKIFDIYLAKTDVPGSEAYARLDLPAQPWALLDALDKLRLRDGEEMYLEIDNYYDFGFLRCAAAALLAAKKTFLLLRPPLPLNPA